MATRRAPTAPSDPRAGASCSEAVVERFRTEVRLARRVTRPDFARVCDVGQLGSDRFPTMDFAEGESLASVLGRERRLFAARGATVAAVARTGSAPRRWPGPPAAS